MQDNAFIDQATLVDKLNQPDVVLLGEKHDNPDHHRLRATLITALASRKAVVGFEQILTSQSPLLTNRPSDAKLFTDLMWEQRGWPEWKIYLPLFKALDKNGLRAVGVNAAPTELKGRSAILPLPETQRHLLEQELLASHCGMLPERALKPVAQMQQAWDSYMAEQISHNGTPFILIAGNGHVRNDRGVPHYLQSKSVVSVAFLEVAPDLIEPQQYAARIYAESLPFDYVWFTPVVDTQDPCEKYREELKRLKMRDPEGSRALH